MFLTRKHIVGKYYLFEEESGLDYSIRYKLKSGDYIGRIPAKVIEFGWNDSLLVAKTDQHGKLSVFIINMKADSDFAEDATYLLDMPQTESEYLNKWQNNLHIKFEKVENRR
jgi:hypothetical protein